ncbi:transmembrane protein, putative (macronuclear) [Tetrahymena thermophila SB210]|uniref:Transmembrane protein, putative n=1 Tax=Tetrahymena thermophila (strain SB210) TaxID=312017 RepID=Q248D5_TETTS|nr:transmembrane protein, putative [Tetrahymena thermophila SB210]EAS04110.2 transmembrane protein, putative [Tetrahymena thermophila SB210]|eukprot:XP_001024355.2 transmembrane protein, putative [Tetrahymena thermophila SB210]
MYQIKLYIINQLTIKCINKLFNNLLTKIYKQSISSRILKKKKYLLFVQQSSKYISVVNSQDNQIFIQKLIAMSINPSFQNYLLKYQVNDEDDLFKIVYNKKFENKLFPNTEKLQLLDDRNEDQIEEDYLKYKQDTYFYFISSAALTIPTAIGVLINLYLNKNIQSETLKIQRQLKVIGGFGIPSFILFNIGAYRRFFKQYEPEVLLRKKYSAYLQKREVRKNY